jgi:hypothetical protein
LAKATFEKAQDLDNPASNFQNKMVTWLYFYFLYSA